MSNETRLLVVMAVAGMVLSTAVHEWAHAMAAYQLGDDTAARQGRLTLSPEAHIDPLGTLLMPVLGVVFGGGMIIGWAKPVPYRASNFTRKVSLRTGELIVAAAGPISNLLLAIICAGIVKTISIFGGFEIWTSNPTIGAFGSFLVTAIWLNLLLAIFNLVPINPLDGFKVLANVVGYQNSTVQFIEQYSLMLFIALIMVGGAIIVEPMYFLLEMIVSIFQIGAELHLLWNFT